MGGFGTRLVLVAGGLFLLTAGKSDSAVAPEFARTEPIPVPATEPRAGFGVAFAFRLGQIYRPTAAVTTRACAPLAQIEPPGTPERHVELDQEFRLRNGHAARVGRHGLTVRFERVTRDDRCPAGDPCTADPGNAVVLVTVQQPLQASATFELHTNPNATGARQYLRYRVRLVRLEPRPIGEQKVPLDRYWATLQVSR